MSSEESDLEMKSALPSKITKKAMKSPSDEFLPKHEDDKKLSTKEMINFALIDLKTRKGTSLYAIKKYLQEKYNVDVEKMNYLIKKSLKTSVEAGTIVQTKGIGASGSFRLAPSKGNAEKKKKTVKKSVEKPTKPPKADKPQKLKITKSTEDPDIKKPKKNTDMAKPSASGENKKKESKAKPNTKKSKKEKQTEQKSTTESETKVKKQKVTKTIVKTPAKKRADMMKRKSIGSIIKPPKMNPKK